MLLNAPSAQSNTLAASTYVFNPCDFAYRKSITINAAQVRGNLSNFPVLVNLTDADLKGKTRADGFDIVFTASDGKTQLAHEIEQFEGAVGRLVAWVKTPTLSASANTVLYMYYGYPALTSPTQNPTQVWDANFAGVWHLAESGNGTPNEYRDSSPYSNNGRGGQGNPLYGPSRVTGRIGYGQNFDNADGQYDLIDINNSPSLDITGNQITLEAWIRFTSNPIEGKWYGILNHKGYYNGYRLIIPADTSARPLSFQLPGETRDLRTSRNIAFGVWQHIVATYNDEKMRVYLDGVQDPNTLNKSDNITPASPENHVWIGYGDQPTNSPASYEWVGQIDEVRISNVARSADWIRTEYNNQNAPSSFYTLGAQTSNASFCSATRTRTPTPTPTDTADADQHGQTHQYRHTDRDSHPHRHGRRRRARQPIRPRRRRRRRQPPRLS